MFCGKCGNAVPDGALFCTNCGASVANMLEDPAPVEESTCGETTVLSPVGYETPVQEETTNAYTMEDSIGENSSYQGNESSYQQGYDQNDPQLFLNTEGIAPSPKKRSLLPILIGVGVLLVAAIVFCVLNPYTKAFFVRTFSSPEKLLTTVYTDSVSAAFDEVVTPSVKEVGNGQTAEAGYEGEVHVVLGDQVLDMISNSAGGYLEDTQWLSDIAISYDASVQDELAKIVYGIGLGDTTVLTAEQFMDMENMKMWLLVPDLSEQALYFDINELSGASVDMDAFSTQAEAMPSPEMIETITLRYAEILLGSFENVEKTSKTVKMNGLSQKMTVLKAEFTEESSYEIMSQILKTAKNDEDIKQILKDMESAYGEDVDLYGSFKDNIEDELDILEENADDADPDNKATLYTYLNSKNEIVGITYEVIDDDEEFEAFSYITVTEGKKFATEFYIEDGLEIEGEGTDDKTKNASYRVSVFDEDLCNIELIDYISDDKTTSGTIRVEPSEEIIEILLYNMGMDDTAAGAMGLMDFAFEVDLSCTEEEKYFEISLMAGKNSLLALNFSAKEDQPEDISVPEDDVNALDDEAMSAWSQNIDISGVLDILERLADAGFPAELLPSFGAEL